MSFNKSNHKHCSCRHLLSAVSFAPVTSTFTNAISKSFLFDSIKKSLLSIALSSVLMSIALSACSSDGKPLKIKSGVDDPVSIEVKGVKSEEVEQNINAYLATLPTILNQEQDCTAERSPIRSLQLCIPLATTILRLL